MRPGDPIRVHYTDPKNGRSAVMRGLLRQIDTVGVTVEETVSGGTVTIHWSTINKIIKIT